MISRNSLLGGLAALAISLTVAGSASAQRTTIAASAPGSVIFTAGQPVTITHNAVTVTDRFSDSNNALLTNRIATLSFTTGAIGTFTGSTGNAFDQEFVGPGSFSLIENGTGINLLSGTFNSSIISGRASGSSNGGLELLTDTLVYTGGVAGYLGGFSNANGGLSVAFVNIVSGGSPGYRLTRNGSGVATSLNSFTADDSIIYTAVRPGGTAVPEPSDFAFASIAGASVMGLVVRARRNKAA